MTIGKLNMKVKVHHGLEKCSTVHDFYKFYIHYIVDNDKLPPKTDPSYRPSARIRPLLDYFNSISMYYYQPFQNISIDESLVGSKSRNPICQYLPNKHHARFGTKIWMLACSKTSYVLKLYVYEGARYDKSSGFGQGYDVIVLLMEMADIYNCGYHLLTTSLQFTMQQISFYVKEHLSLELCIATN